MSEFQKNIDQSLGRLGVEILSVLPHRKTELPKKPKILVIKKKAIGDSIYILPMIKAFHKELNAKIHVLCDDSNKAVFEGHKFIDEIIEFNPFTILSKFQTYDLVIDAEPWANISAIISKLTGKKCIGFSHSSREKLYDKTILYNKKQHIVQTYLDFFRLFSKKKPSDKLSS